jgi:N-acyl-L-homoserine lactone synthetase
MPVRIKIAETAVELESLFRARHRVFVEEEGYLGHRSDNLIVDRFDAFPVTINMVALVEGQVVGGMRVTRQSPVGLPADQFFDFSPYLPAGEISLACASQFFLLNRYRAISYRLGFAIIGMCVYWAYNQNITHVIAAVNPVISRLCEAIGMTPAAPCFYHQSRGVEVVPMLLDMSQAKDPFLAMRKCAGRHELLENYEREFFKAGEFIVESGAPANSAYLIIKGKVSVYVDRKTNGSTHQILLNELGPGEVFGELALLTSRPCTANVKAITDVDLMVMDREHFQKAMVVNYQRLPQILEHMADRLARAKVLLTR